jgi:hypothetical protein
MSDIEQTIAEMSALANLVGLKFTADKRKMERLNGRTPQSIHQGYTKGVSGRIAKPNCREATHE